MSAPIETLLSRLDRVRQVKASSWMSRCPAHNGDGRSLAVSVKEEGTILIHCFAYGCEAGDILAAVGMSVGDLFPEPIPEHRRPKLVRTHGLPVIDVLRVMKHELSVVHVLMSDFTAGTLDVQALERGRLCAQRLQKALDLCSA
jgi:hypothetical protein